MLPANLDYIAPKTVEDAVTLLAAHPEALVVAGGYRAVIDLKMRRLDPGLLIDLRKIPTLDGIKAEGRGLRIGAMTTPRALTDTPDVRKRYTALAEAAEVSGDAQMRNMETLGASLTYDAHNSDVAAALLALNATIQIAGAHGERSVAASDFFGSAGLAQGELVTAVTLPAHHGTSAYEKFKHPATLSAICGVAVSVTLNKNDRVRECAFAVTGASEHPTRLSRAEASLRDQPLNDETAAQAASVAGEGLPFVADLSASAEYREHLLQTLLKRALARLS